MADPTPPTSDGDSDAGTPSAPDSTAPDGATPDTPSPADAAPPTPTPPRRGAHRAPAKPQRVLVVGLIAVAAVVALLVAFGSCGGGFDSGQGVINGTPGVTTAPPTTATPTTTTGSPTPTTTAPTTTSPATTRPATSAPPTTPARTTKPPTATPSPSPTSGPRIPVDVLNGTTIPGLAAQGATQVRAAGWTVATIGNWRATTVSTETVFYGPGDEGSARRLARELSGAQQVKAALSGMSTSKLTLVVLP